MNCNKGEVIKKNTDSNQYVIKTNYGQEKLEDCMFQVIKMVVAKELMNKPLNT